MPVIRVPPDKNPKESQEEEDNKQILTKNELPNRGNIVCHNNLSRRVTNNSNREITTTNTNSIRRTLEAGELHKSYDIRSEQRTYSRDIAIANDVPFNDIEQVSRLIEENPIIDQNHADASTENLGTRFR